jgi:hypothetical protein
MRPEDLQELVRWLREQVETSNRVIEKAKNDHHFSKEVQFEGMREAFSLTLKKLSKAA